ncbi:MAG: adenosylcobalamin-dependent ribonucleoside-diphosphate reductase [Phycisphaerales bacterium]|nr:MAG: adenosylcobalamin-dependent ribonucleoside-diphosphate reductase [Phycisphaerales bacterium]
MKITRKFTTKGQDAFDSVKWAKRSSRITNPDGSVVFEMKDAWLPESWSQLAVDIMVSKYFRKAGVPQCEFTSAGRVARDTAGAIKPILESGKPQTGPEKSAEQVIHRLAGCWRYWGETHNYFDSADDAQAFYDELVYMMVHQMCAPNSPQWFNTGLNYAYGISGPAQGHWIVDPNTGTPKLADDAYTHPQPHACFIQSVDDDLVNEGGIMDLWVREARLFKYGSGTGTNFSHLRGDGEKLSGGGKSSGLMSWLRIGDRAASAIKSGGTTRRAAKMVCLDMDHPDIAEFINWKVREEIKVQAMVEGLRLLKKHDPGVAKQCEELKLTLNYDFNGEAYQTVSGQNSNNSVRIPDSFFEAIDKDTSWDTTWRITGKVAHTYRARDLWDQIGFAAWRCADPGVQFDSTINAWHTCPSAGRINASNPCSEYMFLDNTACNLASLNVLRFYDDKARTFDHERFEHGVDLWTIVLEISVLMAAFPSKQIAELSYRFRTLGLGYANLGAMLMQAGIPYDSDEARAICATLTSILTGRSYRMSALMASEHGPFPGFDDDRDSMLRVIKNHRLAAHGTSRTSKDYIDLTIRPVPIDHDLITKSRKAGTLRVANTDALLKRATTVWDDALALGEKHGYRNAQTTVIAPTGTIGLLMDCDTTGVEPDFALVKFKKLAGGGYFKIANESVEPALHALAYSPLHVRDIMTYILGTLTLNTPLPSGTGTLRKFLADRGVTTVDLNAIEASLPGVFELLFAFSAWSLSEDSLRACGIAPEAAKADSSFNLLAALGLSDDDISALNLAICGTATIEGAPHLKAAHLPIFDCANKCGKLGKRFIAAEGHIRMMAAAQPFISGAISKTINLPNEASVDDIKSCYRLSWELGLKANALYRDGCKLSQPLSATADEAKNELKKDSAKETKKDEPSKDLRPDPTTSGALAPAVATPASSIQAPEPIIQIVHKPMRRRLSDTRRSITHKFNVAGHEGYLTVGLYDDGMPGELFITMSKEGSTIGGLMDSLGTATSVALQYGVPVSSLVGKFSFQRFEPAGMTTNSDIPIAQSLVDYIFRWMGMQFIPGFREQYAPKRESSPKPSSVIEFQPRSDWSAPPATEDASRFVAPPSVDDDWADDHADDAAITSASRTVIVESSSVEITGTQVTASSTLSVAMESMGDAPACDICGNVTVRSGTCHKCLNCGNSMGCS